MGKTRVGNGSAPLGTGTYVRYICKVHMSGTFLPNMMHPKSEVFMPFVTVGAVPWFLDMAFDTLCIYLVAPQLHNASGISHT